jgi:hypothetical protein
MKEHAIEAVGACAAGFVDVRRSTVLFAPNIAWRDEPLKTELERLTDLPVVVESDVMRPPGASSPSAATTSCSSPSALASVAASCSTGGSTAARSGLPRRSDTTSGWFRRADRAGAATWVAGSSTPAAQRSSATLRSGSRPMVTTSPVRSSAPADVSRT